MGRFGGQNDTLEALGIIGNHWCPQLDFNITMQGSFSGENAKLFQVYIDYCT